MSAMVKGKTVEEAEKLFEKFHDLITGKDQKEIPQLKN
jgi:NifU-like protein involved in Fe-S cluster formation